MFAAGTFAKDFGNSDFTVRAYNARTGLLLWDDHSHVSPQTTAVDIALGKFRLFVAGYTTNSSNSTPFSIPNTDFLIRAYDVRPGTTATH